jgi:hypothetical protein
VDRATRIKVQGHALPPPRSREVPDAILGDDAVLRHPLASGREALEKCGRGWSTRDPAKRSTASRVERGGHAAAHRVCAVAEVDGRVCVLAFNPALDHVEHGAELVQRLRTA